VKRRTIKPLNISNIKCYNNTRMTSLTKKGNVILSCKVGQIIKGRFVIEAKKNEMKLSVPLQNSLMFI
jgi:hypothetical protein